MALAGRSSRTDRGRARVTTLLALLVLLLTASAVGAQPPPGETYANPLTEAFADTYADPAVIRGKDGWWYLYATSDPLVEGGELGLMHVARSRDLVSWDYLGTILDETNRPAWAAPESAFWAPDVRYVDGEYVLYYTVTDTVLNPGGDPAIGAATAPTPNGPWTPTDAPVVAPRPDGGGGFYWTFDPALLVDDDGSRYLYFGSYHGGIWVTELDETGLAAVGDPVRLTTTDRYEGAYVVKRGDYYYLMGSSANCCAGPSTGYSVHAGRSTSPTGPFVDAEGVGLAESRVGGSQVLVQNGNRWIGAGHHAVVTDLTGQDWILYHALDKEDPWLTEPGGINERPTLLDRLDWIDGWPVTNAGAGPSDTPLPGPFVGTGLEIELTAPASGAAFAATSGAWTPGRDTTADAGTFAVLDPGAEPTAVARSAAAAPADVRVEADVRLPEGGAFAVRLGAADGTAITVVLDERAGELRADALGTTETTEAAAALTGLYDPATWTALSVEVRAGVLHVRLSESRLGDVLSEVRLDLPPGAQGVAPVSLVAGDGPAHVDNLSVVEAYVPVTERVPEPEAGELLLAEEFDAPLEAGWTWVRPDEAVTVTDGELVWPLTGADLVGPGGTGPLLLRDAPAGEWILETKLDLDLGVDTVRNYQQAGLVVHVDDDDFLRLGHVAIWGTRQSEFGKEAPSQGRLDWGGHVGGPVAPTMWLRVHHSSHPVSGDLLYRSATSRDGEAWRWGATWTLPAGSDPAIGLYAGGGAEPPVDARFDYVRLYGVAAPVGELAVEATPDVVDPGAHVTTTVSGGVPGEAVIVTYTGPDGSVLATDEVTADAEGTATHVLDVPFAHPGGVLTVTASEGMRTAQDTVTVRAFTPTLALSPPRVAPGGEVSAALAGFVPGSEVTLTATAADGTVVAPHTVTVDAAGAGGATLVLPAAVAPGPLTVTAIDAAGRTASGTADVAPTTAPVPTPSPTTPGGPGGELPRTGAGTALAVLAGLFLAAGGAATVGTAGIRRRDGLTVR
ncbi:family 43 glycosylhydrolase [Georgenia sp. MJ206]|uniref:family 43 glycosylhydrolase n=1 Tax=Georgenia wangjunii TaxID=3117730 RepID=UPI002F26B86F